MNFFLLVMSKEILICYLKLHTFPQTFFLFPPKKYALFMYHLSWLMTSPNTGFDRLPVLLLLLLFLIIIDLKC